MVINYIRLAVRGLVNHDIPGMFFRLVSCQQQVFLFSILLHRHHPVVHYGADCGVPDIQKEPAKKQKPELIPTGAVYKSTCS
jgi:hypothetical protein